MTRLGFVALGAALMLDGAAPRLQPDPLVRYVDTTGAYARWWGDVERCAHRAAPRPLTAAKFYAVETSRSVGLGVSSVGFIIAGRANPDDYTVTLGSPWLRDSGVVRHEILHLVVGVAHDPEYFQRRCAAVVSCFGLCLSDTLAATPR